MKLRNWLPKLHGARFSLAAFAIPIIVRAIPEMMAGPYPVGWDVMAFYVPNTLDLAAGRMNLWSVMTSPPVMYAVVVRFYLLWRSSLYLVFKILGPLGLLNGRDWSERRDSP